jgi:NADH:ubiquinone oxidoreductase subunit 6 (subunit J)
VAVPRLLVFLVALGSSRSLDRVGGPGDLAGARLFAANLLVIVIAAAVIPAILFVIWQTRRDLCGSGAANEDKRRERSVIKLALALALVGGAFALLTLGRSPKGRPLNQPPAPGEPGRGGSSDLHSPLVEALGPWIVAGVGALLVVLIAAALILRRRRVLEVRELPADDLESPRRELRELVGISIEEIERESDPRRAVIRAYAGMESTLARHNLGRHQSEAPGEYLGRAFSALRLSRRPGERLTRLFERARFSEHAIDPEMKRESIAALSELRSELEAKPE